jgi:hypothetical protein
LAWRTLPSIRENYDPYTDDKLKIGLKRFQKFGASNQREMRNSAIKQRIKTICRRIKKLNETHSLQLPENRRSDSARRVFENRRLADAGKIR